MVTLAVELARAIVATSGPDSVVLFSSRERVAGLPPAPRAVLSPHRGELLNKLRWLPAVESLAGLDAMLYPYWPSPPRRRRGAPPAAVFVHDLAYRLRPREVPWQQRLYLGRLVPAALRTAPAVLVPSESTGRDLVRLHPDLHGVEARIRVVPEGPTPLPAPDPLPAGLRAGFVLAVGTVERRKNYPRLLDAYAALRARRSDVPPLVVAGRPGWGDAATLKRLAASPGVVHLGHVPDSLLAALYDAAAVLAFPSLYEGFGLPLLDAMVRGIPAVVGSEGALPELGGGAVLTVDAGSPGEISRALEVILDNADLRVKLGEEGRRRAAGYTWEHAAALVLAAIEEARRVPGWKS